MYVQVKGLALVKGVSLGALTATGVLGGRQSLPVTGGLLLGWQLVAVVVLLSAGAALVTMARIGLHRAASLRQGDERDIDRRPLVESS